MLSARAALLGELDRTLSAATAGQGRIVVVSGEAGIGKTTLLRRLASDRTERVLWGACEPATAGRPLLPLHDIARRVPGELTAVLAAETSRYDVCAAVLRELSAEPTVVVVEDLHWADDATLDLLLFLARRISDEPIVALLSTRDEMPPSVATAVGQLVALPVTTRVVVPPLEREEVTALASGTDLDPARVLELTGGNAFFVTELLGLGHEGVPLTVREAVLARIAPLGDPARRLLETLSVCPDRFALDLLAEAAGEPPEALDEAERVGLVVAGAGAVRFRHELAREAVESSLTESRRRQRHAAVLAALVRRPRPADAAVAYHANCAGDHERAISAGMRAAAESARRGARRQACVQLSRAAEHLDTAQPARAVELLRAYAYALLTIGDQATAVPVSERALAVARELADPDVLAGQLADHAYVLWRESGSSGSRALIEESLAVGSAAPESRGNLAGLVAAARLHMLCREIDGSLDHGRRAVALARRLGDRRGLADALHTLGTASWFAADAQVEAAEPLLVEALALARSLGDDRLCGLIMVNCGSAAGEVRRYGPAGVWLRRAIDYAQERDLVDQAPYARAWSARVAMETGALAEAALLAEQCLGASDLIGRIGGETVLGRTLARLGRPGARAHLDQAWALARPTGDLQRTWPIAAGYAEVADAAGEGVPDVVLGQFEQASALAHPWAVGELGWWLVRGGLLAPTDPRLGVAAPPYAALIAGDPATAADAWAALGCRYDGAVAGATSSDPARVRAAIAELDRMGARRDADRAAARLRELDGSTVRRVRAATARPFGLTEREAEVLALLGEGLTNAEIAERTFTSAKTVGHHVSAILAKTGTSSRRDAVRVAAEDGPSGR